MRSSRVLVALAVGAASVGGLATMAHAATPPTVVVLPVFGSTLTVTITANPDGTLNNVALDNLTDYTANTPSLHKVVFTHTVGDAGKVVVRGKNGSQSTSVRVTKLSDLVGTGSWTGSVFGAGDTESVPYTIGATADVPPKPTLSLGTITMSTGVTQTTSTPVHMGEHGDDWVAARVKFAMGDQVRSLSIVVAADNDNDEHDAIENSAKLSIGLSPLRLDASMVTIGADQTWNGLDCTGGALTATYKVNPDGSISVSAPATGVTTGKHGSAVVAFGTPPTVQLFISAKVDGTTLVRVSASPRYHCKATDPAATTNVTVVPTPPPSWSDHGGHKHH